MQRYFAMQKDENKVFLQQSDIHHVKNVMRNKIGDYIEIVFNKKIYLCVIKSLDPFLVEVDKEIFEESEININLTVAVSLVSEQKFDMILQKLTELGVSRIIPIKTERSIVKIEDKREDKKIERWTRICKEASEQSHRNVIPILENIKTLNYLLNDSSELKLLCSLNEKSKSIGKYIENNTKSILFVIGPEGGFTEKEEKMLLDGSFLPVTLGKRVLRVETAALYVASVVSYICEG